MIAISCVSVPINARRAITLFITVLDYSYVIKNQSINQSVYKHSVIGITP